jgi:type IV pilus assembly protein PilA
MKSEFKAKLVNHLLNKKNAEKGFTLIELLVVIIIIGILAAIALPSFLNQAAKARQSEAKTYVGSLNRGQQAYYLEKQQFARDLGTLAVGIAATTTNYGFHTGSDTAGALIPVFPAGKAISTVNSVALPGVTDLTYVPNAGATVKGYIGGVSISTPVGSNEATSLATLCEQNLAPINDGAVKNYATTSALTTFATQAPSCSALNQVAPTGGSTAIS